MYKFKQILWLAISCATINLASATNVELGKEINEPRRKTFELTSLDGMIDSIGQHAKDRMTHAASLIEVDPAQIRAAIEKYNDDEDLDWVEEKILEEINEMIVEINAKLQAGAADVLAVGHANVGEKVALLKEAIDVEATFGAFITYVEGCCELATWTGPTVKPAQKNRAELKAGFSVKFDVGASLAAEVTIPCGIEVDILVVVDFTEFNPQIFKGKNPTVVEGSSATVQTEPDWNAKVGATGRLQALLGGELGIVIDKFGTLPVQEVTFNCEEEEDGE